MPGQQGQGDSQQNNGGHKNAGMRAHTSVYAALEPTFVVSAILYLGPLLLLVLLLTYLERPRRNDERFKLQMRRLRCTTLALLTISVLLRGIWFALYFDGGTDTAYFEYGLVSHLSTATQFSAVIVCCCQCALLYKRILNWGDHGPFYRYLAVILITNFCFFAYYVWEGWYKYNLQQTGRQDTVPQWFARFNDCFTSGFFVLVGLFMVFFAARIVFVINSLMGSESRGDRRGSSLRQEDRGGSLRQSQRLASKTSVRLCWSSGFILAGWMMRAGSWNVSVIKNRTDDAHDPWFYPICFFQIPDVLITLAICCIVGNLDVRVKKLWRKFCRASAGDSRRRATSVGGGGGIFTRQFAIGAVFRRSSIMGGVSQFGAGEIAMPKHGASRDEPSSPLEEDDDPTVNEDDTLNPITTGSTAAASSSEEVEPTDFA